MLDYREGKERYKPNILGSLYLDRSKICTFERPIIYIGGQMEHRCHTLEQTGKTFDEGHNMFTGSWFYDYPLSLDKSYVRAENFAKNFLTSLSMANLKDVDLVTDSFGGLIGAYATKDPRINKVYAVHPPITGTPVANPSDLAKHRELFTKKEKLALLLIKRLIDHDYGFEHDNELGADLRQVDLNKLLVIGSTLDPWNDDNEIAKTIYDMILKVTGLESDGVVVYDEALFNFLGINYKPDAKPLNHFDAGSKENLEEVKRFVLQRQSVGE